MEIIIIIAIIIGIIVGFFLGKLMAAKTASEEKTQLVAKAQVLAAEMEQVKSLTDQVRQQAEKEKEPEDLFGINIACDIAYGEDHIKQKKGEISVHNKALKP